MLKIAIIGATGRAGNSILKEALKRNHTVTAIVRNKEKLKDDNISVIEKDAFQLTSEELTQFDVVVNAIRAPIGEEHLHIEVGRHLIALLENSDTKLLVVGGAGSLYVDKECKTRFIDTPKFPEEFKATGQAQLQNLLDLEQSSIRWTFLSPSALFDSDGPRTGHYIQGKDRLLVNRQQVSYVSYADYAIAVLDELEEPKHEKERFTVASENATTSS